MTKILITLAASGMIAAASIATAGMAQRASEANLSDWEKMSKYEPCMNGSVSASGMYPSQIAEDKSFGTLGFIAGRAESP